MATDIEILKQRAAAAVAQYPQYTGHFVNYRLCRVKRTIRTKMGVAFVAGDLAIAAPTSRGIIGDRYYTVWSSLNHCDTSVPASAVEWL